MNKANVVKDEVPHRWYEIRNILERAGKEGNPFKELGLSSDDYRNIVALVAREEEDDPEYEYGEGLEDIAGLELLMGLQREIESGR